MSPRSRRISATPIFAALVIFVFAVNPAWAAMPSDQLPTLAPLVKEVSPAVVNIATRGTVDVEPRSHEFCDEKHNGGR